MTPPKRLTPEREAEIRIRLKSQPGQETFDPAYMYKNPHADVTELLAEIDALRFELEDSELDFDDVGKYAVEFATATKAAQNERDRLAMGALAGLSQFIATPEKGYVCEPEILQLDIERLGKERDALKAENEDLKVINEVLTNHSGKLESKLRSRIAKLRGVLEDWLACTPSDISGKYSEITQWNACRALEALAQDDEDEKI